MGLFLFADLDVDRAGYLSGVAAAEDVSIDVGVAKDLEVDVALDSRGVAAAEDMTIDDGVALDGEIDSLTTRHLDLTEVVEGHVGANGFIGSTEGRCTGGILPGIGLVVGELLLVVGIEQPIVIEVKFGLDLSTLRFVVNLDGRYGSRVAGAVGVAIDDGALEDRGDGALRTADAAGTEEVVVDGTVGQVIIDSIGVGLGEGDIVFVSTVNRCIILVRSIREAFEGVIDHKLADVVFRQHGTRDIGRNIFTIRGDIRCSRKVTIDIIGIRCISRIVETTLFVHTVATVASAILGAENGVVGIGCNGLVRLHIAELGTAGIDADQTVVDSDIDIAGDWVVSIDTAAIEFVGNDVVHLQSDVATDLGLTAGGIEMEASAIGIDETIFLR